MLSLPDTISSLNQEPALLEKYGFNTDTVRVVEEGGLAGVCTLIVKEIDPIDMLTIRKELSKQLDCTVHLHTPQTFNGNQKIVDGIQIQYDDLPTIAEYAKRHMHSSFCPM